MIAHRASSALATLHIGQLRAFGIQTIFLRLMENKPAFLNEPVLVSLWILNLASTLGLAALSLWLARRWCRKSAALSKPIKTA
jgi:hypothetical protein